MKKLFIMLALCLVAIAYGLTETHTSRKWQGTDRASKMTFKKCVVSTTDVNDFTEALDNIYGIVNRIAIDQTGTEASYTVTLRDENDITIFTKTVTGGDVAYAVYEDDTEGNPWAGVSVGGIMDLLVADANGESMTQLDITIYYLSFWD